MKTVIQKLAKTARNWAHKRQGDDSAPVVLTRQRVYILPTGQGIAFAVLLFAMLMGSMNYNNNLGFVVTFLLAGVALVSMFHCHRNIVGLVVRPGLAKPVYAGQTALLPVQVRNSSLTTTYAIEINHQGQTQGEMSIPPNSVNSLNIAVKTKRRGVLTVSRFGVSTNFPMNLFKAWAWIYLDLTCLVYPKPAATHLQPPTESTDTGGAQDGLESGDDFAGLREFQTGDPPKHIAWKAYARSDELLVRQFAGTSVATQWLDFEKIGVPETETRLSLLCHWILEAHDAQNAYGLRLPSTAIEPNLGDNHKHDCLSALALYRGGT
ncbi:MAG: DUF58 domain-containing protein [Pseudomonadota bacterium]